MEQRKDFDLLREKVEAAGGLPSIPTVLSDLLACIKDETTNTEKIANLIGQDAGLAARLLKVANSSAMGLRVQVTSIQRAVALLGRSQVRQICLGNGIWGSLKPIAAKADFDLEGFELHSLVGAEVAQELATRSRLVDAEDVYAAALLHDIGKFLLLAIERDKYSEALKVAKKDQIDLVLLEEEKLGWTHPEVGGWFAGHWGLPETIRDVATWHHDPYHVSVGGNRNLVALVTVANNLLKVVKVGDSGNPNVLPIGHLLGPLQLTPEDLQGVAEKLK